MIASVLSAATVLLLISRSTGVAATNEATSNTNNADYESKVKQALSYHAAKSQQLIDRALEKGGSAGLTVGPDGTVSRNGVREELWKVDFAIKAIDEELRMLRTANEGASAGDNVPSDNNDESSEDGASDYDISSEDDGDSSEDDGNRDPKDRTTSYDVYDRYANDPDLFPEDKAILKRIKNPRYQNIVYNQLIKEVDIREEIRDQDYPWDELTYWELHASFTCYRVMAGNRPVYDSERWRKLREFYNEFVAEDLKTDPIPEGEPPRTYKFSEDSFDAPTEPFGVEDDGSIGEEDEEKGRGLRAARDIAKGELVFKATNNTVVFNVGYTWRDFLSAMFDRPGYERQSQYDAETTCDFMVWSWIQRLEEDGPLVIVADMDNGSLLNEGRFDDPEYDDPNVRCGKEGDKICRMSYYALRDIKKGEELLCDYKDFALIWSWKEMGL